MIAIHSALVKTLAPVPARDLAEDDFFLTGGVGNVRYLDTGLTFFVDEISADVGVALDVNGRAQTSASGVLGMAQSAGLAKLFDPATWDM